MKNLFYLIMTSALLVVSGCVKEEVNDNSQFVEDPVYDMPMKSVTLDASMLAPVKAIVDESGDFAWTSDDAIAVNVQYWNNDDEPVNAFFKFNVQEISSENDNSATFEGMIPETGTVTGVAVYPYDRGHVYADGKLSVNFPAEVSESNHLPAMYAKVEGETLQFNHLSSMLKLTYRYVPKGTDGMILTSAAVSGLYDVDLETGALTATENVADQVKVTFDALTTMQAEKAVYVPVPAGERSIAAKLTKGEEMVKWSDISSKSARNFKVGKINLLPAVNVHFSELYILGDSKDCYAWKKAEMKPLEETKDHVFTWSGDIFSGNRFRFPVEHNVYYPAVVYNFGDMGFYAGTNNNSLDFTVDKDGNYTVTVDATDMDDIKVDINYNRVAYPDKYLFINGKATEILGYQKAAKDWMWMTQVEPGVFEWTGLLADDTGTDFKFRAKDGEWTPYYDMDVNAEDQWTLHYSDGSTDNKFYITQGDGLYRVTANLNTMKASCEFLEYRDRLYITGNSVSTSGFSNKPGADFVMHYAGNGIYTWTGQMYVTGVTNGFKIVAYGAWYPFYGPATGGSNVGMNGTAAKYDSGDIKWILTESDGYTDGVYTVVLDTVNGTLTVTPM